jgi:hypothetical protein
MVVDLILFFISFLPLGLNNRQTLIKVTNSTNKVISPKNSKIEK